MLAIKEGENSWPSCVALFPKAPKKSFGLSKLPTGPGQGG